MRDYFAAHALPIARDLVPNTPYGQKPIAGIVAWSQPKPTTSPML